MKGDLFPIGRIIKPHGVKGKIKVEYFGEDPNGFLLYRRILIEDRTGRPLAYEVLNAIPQPSRLILQLKGIHSIEEAEPLMGKEILIGEEDLPDLEEGEYYWFEILGMAVETGEGRGIGKVKEILVTGANDVYVVGGKKREIFIPATEEVIQNIDREKRMIKVSRMEGLWEKEDEDEV